MRKPTHLMRKEGRTDRDPTQGEEFQLHLLLRIESHKWELQPAVGHTHTHTHTQIPEQGSLGATATGNGSPRNAAANADADLKAGYNALRQNRGKYYLILNLIPENAQCRILFKYNLLIMSNHW